MGCSGVQPSQFGHFQPISILARIAAMLSLDWPYQSRFVAA